VALTKLIKNISGNISFERIRPKGEILTCRIRRIQRSPNDIRDKTVGLDLLNIGSTGISIT